MTTPTCTTTPPPSTQRLIQRKSLLARTFAKPLCAIALLAVAVAGLSVAFASPASSQSIALNPNLSPGCSVDKGYVLNADLPSGPPPGLGNDLRDDCLILINQYFGTWGGDQSHLPADHPLRQWGNAPYTHISDWPGVTVETVNGAKRITGLDLSNASSTNRGIDSTGLQANFQTLTALKTLDISGNNFSGGLLRFASLSGLTKLDLSNNDFSGSVHPNFSRMTSLTELLLQGNNLSGRISSSLANLLPSPRGNGSLTKLGICGNGFKGTLSQAFRQGVSGAPELVDYPHSEGYNPLACQTDRTEAVGRAVVPLLPSDCNSGTFVDAPAVAGDYNDLRDDCEHLVDMQNDLAEVTGNEDLPSSHPLNSWGVGDNQKITAWEGVTITTVGGVQRVTGLDLSNQNLSGWIGLPITRLSALEDLNLSNNSFSGVPSHCLGRLRLKKLNLSNNNLDDTSWNLYALEYIWRARDRQCSTIGDTVITTFTEIDLSNNSFTEFPNNFVDITSLTKFDVSNNRMRGILPGSINRLTNLRHFDVSNNQLRGSITGNLRSLTNLEYFDASRNQLTGVIPGGTGSLKNVATFNVSNNVLSGSVNPLSGLARSAASPGSLTALGICGNSFTGALPAELQDDATDAPDLLDYPVSEGYDPVACQDDGDWFVRHIDHSREQITESSSQFAQRIGMRADQEFWQWDASSQIWRRIPLTSSFGSVSPGTALAFRLPSDVDFLPDELRDTLDVADENLTLKLFHGWNILAMGGTVDRDSEESVVSFIDTALIDCTTTSGVIAVVRLSPQGEVSVELPCHPSSERRFTPLERISEGDTIFVNFRSTLPVDVTWNPSSRRYETP